MKRLLILLALSAVCAYGQTPEVNVITKAAEALGGKSRILALKTLTIYGYGQQAYQNGGGNITASPDAPQKWVNVNGLQRTIDLEHGRMRLQQRLVQDLSWRPALPPRRSKSPENLSSYRLRTHRWARW